MKKEMKVCLLAMLVVLVAGMIGCSTKKDVGSTTETETVNTETTQTFTVDG